MTLRWLTNGAHPAARDFEMLLVYIGFDRLDGMFRPKYVV
jgi:hypothetical protein